MLAGAYEKVEEFEHAHENYELSLSLDPNDEECLTNYVGLLKKESVQGALEYLDVYQAQKQENKILPVLRVDVLWELGRKKEAIQLFKNCIEENKEKALELFEINPSLKTVSELVLLADN